MLIVASVLCFLLQQLNISCDAIMKGIRPRSAFYCKRRSVEFVIESYGVWVGILGGCEWLLYAVLLML
jgi:hypothetical protein